MRPILPLFLIVTLLSLGAISCSYDSDLKNLCETASKVEKQEASKPVEARIMLTIEQHEPKSGAGKQVQNALSSAEPVVIYDLVKSAAEEQGSPKWTCPAMESQQNALKAQIKAKEDAKMTVKCKSIETTFASISKEFVPSLEKAMLETVKADLEKEKWPKFLEAFQRIQAEETAKLGDKSIIVSPKATLEVFGCTEPFSPPKPDACASLSKQVQKMAQSKRTEVIGAAFAGAMMETGELTAQEIASRSKRSERLLQQATKKAVEVSRSTLDALVKATECPEIE